MITITISSRHQVEMIDVTSQVRMAIRQADIQNGMAAIFTPHTTAAVTINENADPDVVSDLIMEINKLIPFDDHYRHAEGNSAAHLKSSLIGAGETVIVNQGEPVLGLWQGIYFCEFDGPRSRKMHIQVIGA